MPLHFEGSPDPTVGMEVELQIVDRDSGDLRPCAGTILHEIRQRHPGAEARIHRELFTNTLELVTGVSRGIDAAVRDLEESLGEVRDAADALDLDVRLASAGTHPFARWRDQEVTEDARMHGLIESLQQPIRRLLTFGLHVHVGVPDGERCIAAVQLLTRHLPLFIALSASSPYWNGHDTGLASHRALVFEALPLTGLPPDAHTWAEYAAIYESYERAGWCSNHKDMHHDVRPSPGFGTVELRVCDAVPTMQEAAAIAALALCLVVAGDEVAVIPSLERHYVELNKWQAQRAALDGRVMVDPSGATAPISELLASLTERVQPVARQLGCAAELAHVEQILAVGPSCERQRRARAAARGADPAQPLQDFAPRRPSDGPDASLRAVVQHLCDELERGVPA